MSFTPTMTDYAFPWTHLATPVPKEAWPRKLRRTLAAIDFVVISAVVTATFYLLFEPEDHLSGAAHIPYLVLAPILVVAWTALLGVLGTRDRRVMGAGLKEYRQVIWSGFLLFGFLAISSYIVQGSLSRGLFVTALPLGTLSLLLARWATRQALNRLRAQGRAMTPTLIVGSAPQVADLLANLARRTDVGYQAAGVCVVGSERLEQELPERTAQHRPERLIAAAASGRYQAVIISDGLERPAIRELAWRLENRPIELMFLPQLTDIAGPRVSVSDVEGLSLVHVDLPQFTGWKLWAKRAFDIVFASLALIVLSPVFLVVAILIKCDDGGPVIFRQERIGLRGKPFTIHKFRTMELDAEAKIADLIAANGGKALLFKLADDPRITGIGKVLRKYSIDELPQFWTVLRGGMSVVGPRPHLASELDRYPDEGRRRLLIRPGITGLWQINGRSDLSGKESVRLDLRYVENWSMTGDVTIILKTVRAVLRPDGAY